ncbi:MAG: hypothetical protein U0746_07325 [Gemmataceae bacterium]
MSFHIWLRDLAGWLLVGLGLMAFVACYLFLLAGKVIEAGPITLFGIVVFRGGIHLLKVAVAARVCADARREPKIG